MQLLALGVTCGSWFPPVWVRVLGSVVAGLTLLFIIIGVTAGGGTKKTAASPVPAATHSQAAKPVVLTAAQKAANKKLAQETREATARAAAVAKKAQAAQARKDAAAAAAKLAAENAPISATQWGNVVRDPASYEGDVYTITGTVVQYDINSNTFATAENAALRAADAQGNTFVLEADKSLLGNVQVGDTFTAKVSVVGAVSVQSTVGGGSGQEPDFDASTFHVTG